MNLRQIQALFGFVLIVGCGTTIKHDRDGDDEDEGDDGGGGEDNANTKVSDEDLVAEGVENLCSAYATACCSDQSIENCEQTYTDECKTSYDADTPNECGDYYGEYLNCLAQNITECGAIESGEQCAAEASAFEECSQAQAEPTCGDGECSSGETCPADCGEESTCGDGYCDAGEETWCTDDCGEESTCGDGYCDADESSSNCPTDCEEEPACLSCAEYISGEAGDPCAEAEALYNSLVQCICVDACSVECSVACGGAELSDQCQACISADCSNELNACANDV